MAQARNYGTRSPCFKSLIADVRGVRLHETVLRFVHRTVNVDSRATILCVMLPDVQSVESEIVCRDREPIRYQKRTLRNVQNKKKH